MRPRTKMSIMLSLCALLLGSAQQVLGATLYSGHEGKKTSVSPGLDPAGLDTSFGPVLDPAGLDTSFGPVLDPAGLVPDLRRR